MSDSLRDQLLKSGLVQKLKPAKPPAAPQKHVPRGGPHHHAGKHPAGHGQGGKPGGSGGHNRPSTQHKPAPASAPEAAPHEHDLARAYALRARQEKADRERAQREAERAAREKKERKQKLATLLADKALNAADADLPRHFPHGNKIRRVYCTADQLARVNRGEIAIVQLAGRYLLVERDVAMQAQAIQSEALVLLCDPNAPPEDDVPADLVW